MFLCRILNSFANWRKCKINKLLKNCNQRAEHETLKSGLLCLACLLLPLSKNVVILRLWLQKLISRFLYLPLQQISFSTYSKFCIDTSKTLIKNKFKFKVYVKSIARVLIGVKDMVIFNWRYLAFIERKNLTKAQNPLLSKDKGGTNALGVSKSPSRKTFFLHLNIPCH